MSLKFNLFLQVSLDGPNVNLRFPEIVKEKRKDANLKPLLNIGTCGYTMSIMLSSMEQKLVDGQLIKCYLQCTKYLINHHQVGVIMKS